VVCDISREKKRSEVLHPGGKGGKKEKEEDVYFPGRGVLGGERGGFSHFVNRGGKRKRE